MVIVPRGALFLSIYYLYYSFSGFFSKNFLEYLFLGKSPLLAIDFKRRLILPNETHGVQGIA